MLDIGTNRATTIRGTDNKDLCIMAKHNIMAEWHIMRPICQDAPNDVARNVYEKVGLHGISRDCLCWAIGQYL